MLRSCYSGKRLAVRSYTSAVMTRRDDDAILEPYPAALYSAVVANADAWLRRCVSKVTGGAAVVVSAAECDAVIARTAGVIDTSLRDMLGRDPEEQRMSPLQVIRSATSELTEYLLSVGCTPVKRDEMDASMLPEDVFAFGPVTWRDLGDDVHEAGIAWGAWKAATIMSRHRDAGESRP